MSKSSNNRQTIGLYFVFAVCVVFVSAELFVSSARVGAQNTNSSTTAEDEATRGGMMSSNSNTSNANKSTSGSRGKRSGRSKAAASATMAASTGSTRETSADPGTQTDLSGTYTGTVNYPEGGVTGPATVVITGNNFVLTPDGGGAAISGRVTAVTTRGYVAVTMMFGDTTPPPVTQSPPPLPAVSLRARIAGGRVTLSSVPGEKREFSFTTVKAKGSGRMRGMHV